MIAIAPLQQEAKPNGKAPGETEPRDRQAASTATVPHPAHIIVVGNEKGGSGKTTTAIHIIVALLRLGKKVGAIDLDSRQRSLDRYLANRERWRSDTETDLPMPIRRVISRSEADLVKQARDEEAAALAEALSEMVGCDFVVFDSPGSDTFLSRLAHGMADTIVTPMNDSFVDFDLLASIDAETLEVKGPSLYSELVWESRKRKALNHKSSIDWVVMRNRIASLDAKNKRRVGKVLNRLASRIGFRLAPGFGERVIFRELFLTGRTLFDLKQTSAFFKMSMSHVAARQEVRELLAVLELPGVAVHDLDP